MSQIRIKPLNLGTNLSTQVVIDTQPIADTVYEEHVDSYAHCLEALDLLFDKGAQSRGVRCRIHVGYGKDTHTFID
jgi:hypothetical protein